MIGWHLAFAAFAFGVLLGLAFGPATERLESARREAWERGWRARDSGRLPKCEASQSGPKGIAKGQSS